MVTARCSGVEKTAPGGVTLVVPRTLALPGIPVLFSRLKRDLQPSSLVSPHPQPEAAFLRTSNVHCELRSNQAYHLSVAYWNQSWVVLWTPNVMPNLRVGSFHPPLLPGHLNPPNEKNIQRPLDLVSIAATLESGLSGGQP